MKKLTLIFINFSFISFIFLSSTFAARKRIRVSAPPASTGGSAPVQRSAYGAASSSVKFRGDRKAIILTLSNMSGVSSVSYQLTYLSNGISQGVMGQVDPSIEPTATRELLFGTCSHGVCTYHTNIQNARLIVKSHLSSGLTVVKPYRIKP